MRVPTQSFQTRFTVVLRPAQIPFCQGRQSMQAASDAETPTKVEHYTQAMKVITAMC